MKKIGVGTLNFTKKNSTNLSKNFSYFKKQKIFIDTSPNYGNFYAEKSLKNILKKKRENFFVATKFGLEFDYKKKTFSKKIKLNKEYIINSLEKSLRDLDVKYLDLFQIHSFHQHSDHDAVIDIMLKLKKQHKILNIGCVNFNFNQINKYEKKVNNSFFDYVQVHYNFFERRAEKQIIPYCVKYKKKIIVNRIFGSGIFVKRNDDLVKKRVFSSSRLKKKYSLMKKKIIFFFNELEKLSIDEKSFLISWMKKSTDANIFLFGVRKSNDLKKIKKYFEKPLNIKKIRYIDNLMQNKFQLSVSPKSFHE